MIRLFANEAEALQYSVSNMSGCRNVQASQCSLNMVLQEKEILFSFLSFLRPSLSWVMWKQKSKTMLVCLKKGIYDFG